jgi:anti-sigma B factor antagonist
LMIDPGKRLDNNNAQDMVETLLSVRSEGYTHVIIDMNRLEFLSSAGVGSILGTVENFRAEGGDIVLCNASPEIIHVFRVLDLIDYLTVKASADEAVQYCKTG